MSVATDIILVTGLGESRRNDNGHPKIENLNLYLSERYGVSGLAPADQTAGGAKHMQCRVFLTAINNIDEEEFVTIFCAIPWDEPEYAQLFLKGEEEDVFSVHTVSIH